MSPGSLVEQLRETAARRAPRGPSVATLPDIADLSLVAVLTGGLLGW